MNRHLFWLTICQGWLMTNNVALIAINGLVGLQLAPQAWMATLPVMAYVVGSALSADSVAKTQAKHGRKISFQLGLFVALGSVLLCGLAVWLGNFVLLIFSTTVAGYYNANGNLYRFAAAELCEPNWREKAVSVVMAGGLLGAFLGPNLASLTKDWLPTPYVAVYLMLAFVALLGLFCVSLIQFPAHVEIPKSQSGRPLLEIIKQPVFFVSALCGALSFGAMSLIMTSTPLAMDVCGFSFDKTALVLQWHVIGMFAPGFVTGHLIRRFGAKTIMSLGLILFLGCIVVALSGADLHQFVIALFLLGVGWNFVYTGSTTLSMLSYRPEEKDRAQAALNVVVFVTTAFTALFSGVLMTSQGWIWLQWGSLVPVLIMAIGLIWLVLLEKRETAVKPI